MLKDSHARSLNPKGHWQGALFLKSIISVPLFQSPPPLICPQDCPQVPKGWLGFLWDVSNYGLKKQFVLFVIAIPVPFLLSRKKMHLSLLLPHKASQGPLKPYSFHLAFLKSDLKIWHPNISIWTFRFQTRHKSKVGALSSELSLGLPLWQGENIIRTPPPYPHFALFETEPHLKAPCGPESMRLEHCWAVHFHTYRETKELIFTPKPFAT